MHSGHKQPIRKKAYLCYDGPFAGHTLWLHTTPTLTMRTLHYHGRYERMSATSTTLIWKPL